MVGSRKATNQQCVQVRAFNKQQLKGEKGNIYILDI